MMNSLIQRTTNALTAVRHDHALRVLTINAVHRFACLQSPYHPSTISSVKYFSSDSATATVNNAAGSEGKPNAPDAEPINPEDYVKQNRHQFPDAEEEDSSNNEKPYRDEEDPDPVRSALRKQIIDAALTHVPELGWTNAALRAGASQLGLSTAAAGIVTEGPAGLVEHVIDRAHKRMQEKIAAHPNFSTLTTSERLEFACRARLEGLIPWIPLWPQALALLTQPSLTPRQLRRSAQAMDEIWYLVGDQSSDITWYTKRTLLSAVYISTELFLITDRTAGQAATWSFLHRQIEYAKWASTLPNQASSIANIVYNVGAAVWTRFVPSVVPKQRNEYHQQQQQQQQTNPHQQQ
jgi:rpsU-divergently transcribed protein